MVWFHEAGHDRGCWFPGAQVSESDVAVDASLLSKKASNNGVIMHWLIDDEVSWVPWRSKGPHEPCFRAFSAITAQEWKAMRAEVDKVYGENYGRRWQQVVDHLDHLDHLDQHKHKQAPAARRAAPAKKRLDASSVLPHGFEKLKIEGFEYDNSLTYVSFGSTWETVKQPLPPGQVSRLEVFRLEEGHFAYSRGNRSLFGVKVAEGRLQKDQVICYYAGIVVHPLIVQGSRYCWELGPGEDDPVIDASRVGNVARFINDGSHSGKKKGRDYSTNCEAFDCEIDGFACVEIRALREIFKGEELLISYGEKYWKHITPESSPRMSSHEETTSDQRTRRKGQKEVEVLKGKLARIQGILNED